jgi:hypothetical protein
MLTCWTVVKAESHLPEEFWAPPVIPHFRHFQASAIGVLMLLHRSPHQHGGPSHRRPRIPLESFLDDRVRCRLQEGGDSG